MKQKPWNLVIFVINGVTLNNLKGLDGEPVIKGFQHVSNFVGHVGQENVALVFTHVGSDKRKEEIDRWLLKHSFFDRGKSGMLYNKLLFLPETDGPAALLATCERFRSDSYTHTLLVSDDISLLAAPTESAQEMTRVFCNLSPAVATDPKADAAPQGDAAPVFRVMAMEELKKEAEDLFARRR